MPRVSGALGVLAGLAAIAVIGGYLTLRRPDLPYDALERHYGNAQSRYVDLPDGVHLHYRDQGLRTGPAVLLIHGYSASLHAWEPWIARGARLWNDANVLALSLKRLAPDVAVETVQAFLDTADPDPDEAAAIARLKRL